MNTEEVDNTAGEDWKVGTTAITDGNGHSLLPNIDNKTVLEIHFRCLSEDISYSSEVGGTYLTLSGGDWQIIPVKNINQKLFVKRSGGGAISIDWFVILR